MTNATVSTASPPAGMEFRVPPGLERQDILDERALTLFVDLERRFGGDRRRLLAERATRQARLDAGQRPDFSAETAEIRARDWTVAPLPDDLLDRRVEITGPPDRKMVINALNSGASVFMADFEDSLTPTWANLLDGQINLRDAARGDISFEDAARGKTYRLNEARAALAVRPRGWHLDEAHVLVDGAPMAGGLFDAALFLRWNAHVLLEQGRTPHLYLPKLESRFEARLWRDVLSHVEKTLGLPHGSVRVTVLIETILAAFEMDEILWELKDRAAGLNCGRWDYIFSYIKKFRNDPAAVLPDRAAVTMTTPFLRAYSLLAIKTCHRRGASAMGGMAAFIPVKGDEAANAAALAAVRADKEREAGDGHDGTWVAHPGLVPVARDVFDRLMPEPNQIGRRRDDVEVKAGDLLAVPDGPKTEAGLRQNVSVGLGYLEAWLRGVGCVPLFNLMEDAATAEISRAQVWQQLRRGVRLDDGRTVDRDLVESVIESELVGWRERLGDAAFDQGRWADAAALFRDLIYAEAFPEFLTLAAYDKLIREGA